MSLLLALLAATPAAVPPPTAAVAREIVVIGQKLKSWKGGVSKVDGRMVCRTGKSTGDKALDAIRCGAMLTCMKPLEARVDALMASDRTQGEKRRAFDRLLSGIEPCLADYEAAAVTRLAEAKARP